MLFLLSLFALLLCIFFASRLFVFLSFRCFPSSHANSWPASKTPAGTRNTLGMSLQIHTGQTCTRITRSAFARCSSIWGELFENTWSAEMEKHTACAAFPIFTSSASQSVAQRTCTTDWGCTLMLSSPLSKSHTGGPARGLVSKGNGHLWCRKHSWESLPCKCGYRVLHSGMNWIQPSFVIVTPPSLNTEHREGLISGSAEPRRPSFTLLWHRFITWQQPLE